MVVAEVRIVGVGDGVDCAVLVVEEHERDEDGSDDEEQQAEEAVGDLGSVSG